jgi:hypothetical protein
MKTGFYVCTKCGKRLIGRKKNGTFVFLFGGANSSPLVHIEVFGSIRMKCLRRSCRRRHPDHWNVFTFFPDGFSIAEQEAIGATPKEDSANPAPELIKDERSDVE